MTYDQIEKMDRDDLIYAFKRMTEIAEEAAKTLKEMDEKYDSINEDYCAHAHIGMCEASFSILKGKLDSVIHVVTKK
jgi:Zn-dependent M32 family carboxypeptidase